MRIVIFLLASLLLLAPAFAQCPAGCNCAANSNTCASCKAGYKATALTGATPNAPTACELCAYRSGNADMNMATTCLACHETCSQCSGAMASQCLICRDGFRLTGVTNGLGTCMFCPAGKGRARLLAIPATVADEPESICALTCLATAGCCRCATAAEGGCVNCQAGWRWDGNGKCAWCTGALGKGVDPVSYWGSTMAVSNADACKTTCTEKSCGTCSDTAPGVCLACAAGMTLKDGKCTSASSSATILPTLIAAITAAYVMF